MSPSMEAEEVHDDLLVVQFLAKRYVAIRIRS